MKTDEVTEITELEATKVAGVEAPANRVPFILLKAKANDMDGDGDTDAEDKAAASAFEENAGGEMSDKAKAAFAANAKRVKSKAEKDADVTIDADKVEVDGDDEDGDAEKSDSAEADRIEETMTGEAAKAHAESAFCGDESCEKCVVREGTVVRLRSGIAPLTKAAQQARAYWEQLRKKDMAPNVGGGVDLDKVPDEDFAGKDRSFPIVTPADVSDAASSIGRAGDDNYSTDKLKSNIIAIAQRKGAKFVAELPDKWRRELDAKKGDVQDALQGTKAPEAAGVLDGSRSGVAGPATGGAKDAPITIPDDRHASSPSGVVAQLRGGESAYTIPAEQRLGVTNPGPTSGQTALGKDAMAAAALLGTIRQLGEQRQAQKDGGYLSILGPTADQSQTPGSMPWESYDSATLDQVAQALAACCNAVEAICTREQIEALNGDPGDQMDAWDLQDAACCLDSAMGIVARLAYAEGAAAKGEEDPPEGAVEKAYRRLRATDEKALRDAHAALGNVLAEHDRKVADAGQDDNSKEEDKIQMELTKSEFIAGVQEILKAERKAESKAEAKQAKKAAKKAKKQEKAVKNANNGGDITAQQMQDGVNGEHDADDVEAVGGKVDPKFINKSDGESDQALKSIQDQLKATTEQLASLGETVQKMAKRPRAGGPVLDGQARGVFPAAEARTGEVSKGEGDEQTQLIKSLEEQYNQAIDPLRKQELGYRLTHERFRQAHSRGQI